MRWNNEFFSELVAPNFVITPDPREIIYHDEINMRNTDIGGTPDGPGALICRYSVSSEDVEWLRPGSSFPTVIPSNNVNHFRTIIDSSTNGPTRSQLARVVQTPSTEGNEGLWSCNGGNLRVYVSLYRRGQSYG